MSKRVNAAIVGTVILNLVVAISGMSSWLFFLASTFCVCLIMGVGKFLEKVFG